MLTGVFARGVRPEGHVPFQQLEQNVIGPLRQTGMRVRLWGFNNIPPTIDGDPVPQDGAKSYFPEFDHYEEWKQEDIDASEWAAARSAWLDEHAFSARAWHRRKVPQEQGAEFHRNMVRLNATEKAAIERLRVALERDEIRATDMVVCVYPEFLVAHLYPAAIVQLAQARHIGVPRGRKRGVYDGFLIGRADVVLEWYGKRETPTQRSYDYETWHANGMREMVQFPLPRATGGGHRPRLKGCEL